MKAGSASPPISRKKWMYMAEFKCACSQLEDYRNLLLTYCGTHGDDRRYVHKLKYDPKLKRGLIA